MERDESGSLSCPDTPSGNGGNNAGFALGSERVVVELTAALTRVRSRLGVVLPQMLKPPPLTRSLPAALRDATHHKENVRVSAINDLGAIASDDPSATVTLERALTQDRSEDVRRAAALALADSNARGALTSLVSATADVSPRVRQMALLALGELGTAERPDIVAALQRALRDPLPGLRFQALSSLVALEQDVEQSLTLALKDSDAQLRLLALRLLAERPDAELSPALRELVRGALDDSWSTLRMAAALVLTRQGDSAASQVLCAVLNDPRAELDGEEEQLAIDAVADAVLRDAVPGLRRRANSAWWSPSLTQWPSRAVLASFGDPDAQRQILRGLEAWSWQTRTQAAIAAGKARLKEAQERLTALLAKPNAADPDAVQEALRLIAGSAM
jgi:HEAT repeat protein